MDRKIRTRLAGVVKNKNYPGWDRLPPVLRHPTVLYARREVRMWLSQKKMTATDTTVFFVLGSKSFCCTAAIHSARMCGSFRMEKRRDGPGSILHQHDERSWSLHTTVAFSWRNRSLEIVQAKKKKNPWPYSPSATSTLNIEHEATWSKN